MQLYFEGSFVRFDPALLEYLLFELLRTLLESGFFCPWGARAAALLRVHDAELLRFLRGVLSAVWGGERAGTEGFELGCRRARKSSGIK
jgi:hypothetical protein